jgi:hypothetical protein
MASLNAYISILTLSLTHLQLLAFSATGIQAGSAKFTASAILYPALNPEWYAAAREITNSPGL